MSLLFDHWKPDEDKYIEKYKDITGESFYGTNDELKNLIESKISSGYTTLKEFWQEFIKRRIVKQTRIVGKAKMFKLNLENPEVKLFIKLYWMVIEKRADELKPIKQII